MAPMFATGDVAFVAPLSGPPNPGDVITFRHPLKTDTLVTHRVADIATDGSLTTRGDANSSPDPYVVASQDILGVTRYSLPLVGRPLVWLRSRNLLALAVWGCATAAAASMVIGQPRSASTGSHMESSGTNPQGEPS
jgi:signal peptidase